MRKWVGSPILALLATWGATHTAAEQSPQGRLAAIKKEIQQAKTFDFGKVRSGDPVEHVFEFRNSGTETLEVKSIQLTPPLTVAKMTRRVKPGETASVAVRLEQPRRPGDFEGLIVIHFTKEDAPEAFFRVQGRVVGPIDFEPMRAFFVTAFKGESTEQSLEITNYESEPLRILKVEHDDARFATDLATVEAGRRYRLTLRTKESAPAGKSKETIRLLTSNERSPVIQIPANMQVRDRVYSFPDSITLGLIDSTALKNKPQEAAFLSQVVTVYQRQGADFQITADSDVPFLRLTKQQAQLKDRYELQVEVVPEKLKPGAVNGFIRITTNDAEFPRLMIPVTGHVTRD